MSVLTEFFKGSDTRLGVFYPSHYLVAVFRTPEIAGHAAKKLHDAGFPESEVIATNGAAVIELDREEKGLGSLIMQAASRLFATEQKFTDRDLDHARRGAGFVAVHCPDDTLKHTAWNILKTEEPLDARYYASAAIEHLAGDPRTD